MPELPEVETVRRRLEPVLVGRSFEHVEIEDARLTRPEDPAEVAAELTGERVASLERRGKYLVVRFESGRVLLIHLRMTGNFLHAPAGEPVDVPHRRAVVKLDDGSDVVYRDIRRFGTWLLVEPDELDPYLATRLGGEPLGRAFTAKALSAELANRKAPVKAALLDQRTLAGLGNIYVDEALWRVAHPSAPSRARARPTTRSRRSATGSSRPSPPASRGRARRYATSGSRTAGPVRCRRSSRSYGRDGEPCDRCGTPIEKTRVAGRGTWYCPDCQRR